MKKKNQNILFEDEYDDQYDVWYYEKKYRERGCHRIAGVDEAGRGPLAGPVCAAAVILPEDLIIEGVNDSKKLTEKKREALFDVIKEKAIAWSVAWASVEEIEEMNILNASLTAMKRAIESLKPEADCALIDGNRIPLWVDVPCYCLVKGDSLSHSIAAASILAKVSRDRLMLEYAEKYPQYHFEKHKGYGTKAHEEALKIYGPCEIHRQKKKKKFEQKYGMRQGRTVNQRIGDYGEDYVLKYLIQKGYELVARNYHSFYGEIDLIVRNADTIVFVEVKTRKVDSIVEPVFFVDKRKQTKIVKTALMFLQEHPYDLMIRLDVAEVVYSPNYDEPVLNYIDNAFFWESPNYPGGTFE